MDWRTDPARISLTQDGPGLGPVALPELVAAGAVVGLKNSVPPTFVRDGREMPTLTPALDILHADGPASVPSLFQSSQPLVPSSALK